MDGGHMGVGRALSACKILQSFERKMPCKGILIFEVNIQIRMECMGMLNKGSKIDGFKFFDW